MRGASCDLPESWPTAVVLRSVYLERWGVTSVLLKFVRLARARANLYRWVTCSPAKATHRTIRRRKLTDEIVNTIRQMLIEKQGVMNLHHIQFLLLERIGVRLCIPTISRGHMKVGHLRDPSCKPGLCKDLSSCLACCIPCARVGASRDAEDNKAKTKPCGYPHKALHLPCLSAHVFSGLPCGKTPRGVRCQREPLVGFGCCCSGGDLCYFSHFSS